LLNELENAFVRGRDEYPKTLTSAYKYLVAYRPPKAMTSNSNSISKAQEIGMTYATTDGNGQDNGKNSGGTNKNSK
jgi:hypothetical protein